MACREETVRETEDEMFHCLSQIKNKNIFDGLFVV